MTRQVDTRDITAVKGEVQSAYESMFPNVDGGFVPRSFAWVQSCFAGDYPGYLPIDARYHDLEHTLQGTLCMSRILHRRHLTGLEPLCTPRAFELGLAAILLHDTGYLKRDHDLDGTGAKYTLVHVRRSMDFAEYLLRNELFAEDEIKAVRNMIGCTGINVDLSRIPFQNELEKIIGFALGTGDLLGQMAAFDYVDKLPILFEEFAEAQRFSSRQANVRIVFTSAKDLMEKTPLFWEQYVRPKIETDFGGLYRFLNDPYPNGPNSYLDQIELNLELLRQQVIETSRQI